MQVTMLLTCAETTHYPWTFI